MTHYSENPGMVRVDYFKESGKWYMSEALDMSNFWRGGNPYDAARAAMVNAGIDDRLSRFIVVILKPYHEHAYPLMWNPYAPGSGHGR